MKKVQFRMIDEKPALQDLFVYTDLVCNLQCKHCFVSSSPSNRTLDSMTEEDLKPHLKDAKNFGVKQIYFTGGEPFVNKQIIAMIHDAMQVAPVTVYTNATTPLEQKMQDLPKEVFLRVSLDHYDSQVHDIFYGRGKGSFEKTVGVIQKASQRGNDIAITTQTDIHNRAGSAEVDDIFKSYFKNKGVILSEVKVLPAIPQGKQLSRFDVQSREGVSEYDFSSSGISENNLMCHVGRTLLKYEGQVSIFPCTILIPLTKESWQEFSKFRMGSTLEESFKKEQELSHPSCKAYCVIGKQTCANK